MIRNLLAVSALALVAGSANAATFNDATGDIFTGAGGGILDIVSLDVTNTATSISFQFTLNGDIAATNWGKYMVIIDSTAGGDTAGNGWGRPISLASGAETWLGGWADGGAGDGVENRRWNGSAWTLNGATYNATPGLSVVKTATTIKYTVLLADVGLSLGQTIKFDGFSSGGGGGDGAVDSVANPDLSVFDWGDAYVAGGSNPVLTYTLVPTPGFAGLVGAAGLVGLRRRR
jgi:hypothetical protein